MQFSFILITIYHYQPEGVGLIRNSVPIKTFYDEYRTHSIG